MIKVSPLWQFIIILLCVGVIVIFFGISQSLFRWGMTPSAVVKEYSSSGTVTSIKGNEITFNTARAVVGKDGNYIASEGKKIVLDPKTIITKITKVNGVFTGKTGTIKDITVGKTISVYTNTNPTGESTLKALRVDILF